MRTLAIGDIHGCLTALNTLLRLVAPTASDRLITLGDYVDRGPASNAVVALLAQMFESGQLIALRGNHDEMMVEACKGFERRMWLSCGGIQTLRSYGHGEYDREYHRIPERHLTFLDRDCLNYYETDTHIFVHASVYPDIPIAEQDNWVMLWQKMYEPIAHCSGKVVICGHTRQREGVPMAHKTAVCIDTGAYDPEGWLTCLHVESGKYWQANERGQTRSGWLQEEA